MPLRYLFGPVSADFAAQNLAGPRQQGTCLAFHTEAGADLTIRPTDTWEQVRQQLPAGWQPDFLVLHLPYVTVPACLWSAPLPRVALAPDWHLQWHHYRGRLPACDLVLTDAPGAELLKREGITQARAGQLCGCERVSLETTWPDGPRDIDLLFVGNLNPAVQKERTPWLTRLARLGRRWRVLVRTGVFGDSHRRLLRRARIVFQYSAWHKCGRRPFEAAAAGALFFQEEGNREVPAFFRDRQECVFYTPENLEELVAYYLEHEEERRALAEAARARVQQYRFEDLWAQEVQRIEADWPALQTSAAQFTLPDPREELFLRCWQALSSSRPDDGTLLRDLERRVPGPGAGPLHATGAEASSAELALLANALGVMLGQQAGTGPGARAAAEVAADCLRRVVEARPDFVLGWLNRSETLDAAGQRVEAIEAARHALTLAQRDGALDLAGAESLPGCRGFDVFRVEWERSAWENAGRPEAEARAKRDLVLWRLHTLLGQWTGDLHHFYEAALHRPDLASTRAALGHALLRAGHSAEGAGHLHQALQANPLDRDSARSSFQVLGSLGDPEGQRRLAEDRRLLARAVPGLIPVEPWFAEPRPRGNELASILILCCNQLDCTRQCLDSLLRHTRRPYEVILVDNGSSDGTAAFLEEFRGRPGPSRVEVIRNETNLGFAAGCNQALARARGRYLVLLNNDTVLTPGWLDGLIRWSLHDWPEVGLVGPVTNGAPAPQGIRVPYQNLEGLDAFAVQRHRACAGQSLTVRRLTGFCLLLRREVLERVGAFDGRFGLGFFEDDDLCLRAREAGFRLLVAQDVYVHHFGNRTFRGLGLDTREKLQANFALFQAKWGPEHTAGYYLPPERPAEQGEAPPAAAEITPPAAEVPAPLADTVDRPRVSLCMIVRNEEHHLPACLESVRGLFDDMVVVDTGSADRTREVARDFGARVFDFPWVDSFGAARNESLRHAAGKWIMWLDADDRLDADNRERLRKVLAGLGDERDAYAVKVRSVLDEQRTTFRLLDQVRIFPNLPEVRWDYRIHEQILPAVNKAGGGVRWTDIVIDHVGYQDASMRQRKLERNLRLLELDDADRPEDSFTLFNLGWTLMDLGRTEEALARLERSLERAKPEASILRKLYHLLAVAQRQRRRPEEALKVCRDGLARFPDDAELLLEEGLLLRDRGDLDGAGQSWLRLLTQRRGDYFGSEEVGLRGYRTRQLLAEVYWNQGRLAEAEVQWRAALAERPDFEPSWHGLGELFLRQGRWADLEELLQRVQQRGPNPKAGWLGARGQAQRQDWAGARRTLEGVIAQDSQAIGPRVLLSQVLLQEGRDWGAAERALRAVLTLDPEHAETRHNLEILLRRQGRAATPVGVSG